MLCSTPVTASAACWSAACCPAHLAARAEWVQQASSSARAAGADADGVHQRHAHRALRQRLCARRDASAKRRQSSMARRCCFSDAPADTAPHRTSTAPAGGKLWPGLPGPLPPQHSVWLRRRHQQQQQGGRRRPCSCAAYCCTGAAAPGGGATTVAGSCCAFKTWCAAGGGAEEADAPSSPRRCTAFQALSSVLSEAAALNVSFDHSSTAPEPAYITLAPRDRIQLRFVTPALRARRRRRPSPACLPDS